MISIIFPLEERAAKRRSTKNISTDSNKHLNRSQRKTGEYKKFQDLYLKNKRLLVNKIVSSEPTDVPVEWPSMQSVMSVHGEVFKSASPPFDDISGPYSPDVGDFTPVLPTEPKETKKRWPRSAPGKDGVTVSSVVRCSDNILAVLFNILLQPIEWREMRTILIPKSGKNRKDANNWRPITIGAAPQRLLHTVLANRLSNTVPLNVNQRGFVKTDGTFANSLTLDTIINDRTGARMNTSILSMDLKKKLSIRSRITQFSML